MLAEGHTLGPNRFQEKLTISQVKQTRACLDSDAMRVVRDGAMVSHQSKPEIDSIWEHHENSVAMTSQSDAPCPVH